MSNTKVKIKSCFFGGYNKKCTDAYINELWQTIEELESDQQAAVEADESNRKRIEELEKACQELQESNMEQEKQIEQQKNEIQINEKVIQAHKETIQSREDIIRRQEEALQDKKEAIRCGQESIAGLKLQLEAWDGRYKELEILLEQKELAAEKDRAQIMKLEDQLEKQQWLYEEFFRDKEKIPVSKLERYIQRSIKNRIRQKR